MKDVFIPLRVSCLYDPISIFTNKFTFPGWVFVPRNPHPKGNEYHNICYGGSRIMYRWELIEGTYMPKELARTQFETLLGTSTMELVGRMTKPLCLTGKRVIMDSGFFVLKWLIGMYEKRVNGSSVVKKCRYLIAGIYCYQINSHSK